MKRRRAHGEWSWTHTLHAQCRRFGRALARRVTIGAVASRSQTEQQQTSLDIAEVLKELELKIDRLKVLYEQYFMGIEKMEPQVSRKEVTRLMLQLQQQYIRNTAMRFKFNTMLQRWQLYITYWNRTLREIENGTYVRHLQKAKRKAETAQSTLAQANAKAATASEALPAANG